MLEQVGVILFLPCMRPPAMSSMNTLVVSVLLLAGASLAQMGGGGGGKCNFDAASSCALDGSDASYTETVSGLTRRIQASGCPNNNPHVPCIGDNPNAAVAQDYDSAIPSTPQFNGATYEAALAAAYSLADVGSLVGIARNGIAILSPYAGRNYGTVTGWDNSAVLGEGDTFDYCGG